LFALLCDLCGTAKYLDGGCMNETESEELVDQLGKLALTDKAERIRKKTYNMDPQ